MFETRTGPAIVINTSFKLHYPRHSHKVICNDDGSMVLLPDIYAEGDLVDVCGVHVKGKFIFTPPGGPQHSHFYYPNSYEMTAITNDHYHILPGLEERYPSLINFPAKQHKTFEVPDLRTNHDHRPYLYITCENPECPQAGRCGGKCADDFQTKLEGDD